LEYFAELPGRNGKERAEARGLWIQLRSVKSSFIFHLLDCLLPVVNCASKYMQSKSADIATASDLVSSTIVAMEAMRCDDVYSKIYNDAIAHCASLEITVPKRANEKSPPQAVIRSPATARVRHAPLSLRDSVVLLTTGSRTVETLPSNDNVDPYKREMFEIIDTMVGEMKTRFEQKKNRDTCLWNFQSRWKKFHEL